MKKFTRKLLLSALATLTAGTATVATAFSISTENSISAGAASAAGFEMVDGASIRMATPLGLRFIAQMSDEFYQDLMNNRTDYTKKMGIFIIPYDYLNDASRYSNGATGVSKKQYQNITKKIDHVFYDSADSSVDDKIYKKDGVYCANGVISNLLLKNYDRDFVGIAYMMEEIGGITKYTFADFDKENNVRNAVYVAVEAYEDYTDAAPRAVFNEYIWGAYLADKGMTSDGSTYTYQGTTYDTITEVATATDLDFSISLDKSSFYMEDVNGTLQLNATITDGTAPVTVNGVHAVWKSSNEAVATVDENGKVTANQAGKVTISASFMGETQTCDITVYGEDFESIKEVPSYMTKGSQTASLSIVELNGNKVLKMTGGATGTNHALNVTLDFLHEVFADPNVTHLAFDVKSETTQHTNFRRSTIRTTGTVGSWGQEPYEADVQADNTQVMGYRPDAFKTFFFSRTDYNNWVSNNKTVEMLISAGNFAAGESLYVDNIRPVTQAQYNAANYGFETGGIRPNGGNLLVYYANTGNAWQYAITADNVEGVKPTFSDFGFTNENVTEGNRALKFTKTAGQVTMRFNSTDVANFKGVANATGYYAFDLYVPAESDAVLTYPNIANSAIPGHTPNKGGWMTIYCTNATNVGVKVMDTTGGTYMMDNFRSVSAADYTAAQYGFEAGTGGLRTNLLNGADEFSGAFYYYYKGNDYNGVRASISVGEGNTAGDANAISNARMATDIVHSGSYSLAFDKGNGYVSFSRHADSEALTTFAGGFTFWIYSTVGVNGTTAKNFINGLNNKFNGGEGINIPANTWTKVIVKAEDINSNGRFLIIQGSSAGTIYLDDFRVLTAEDLETEEPVLPEEPDVPEINEEDLTYNVLYASEDEGTYTNVMFASSTHSLGNDVLPKDATDTEDMSFMRFGGNYGLNDFLVFDFTGDNVPLMTFFTTEVTNSVFNQQEDANAKGWLVANGMTTKRGLIYSGATSNLANRLNIIGPYKVNSLYDNTINNTLPQTRTSEGNAASPSPITMPTLQSYGDTPFRMIVGWVENGSNMNLRMVVYNLSTGQELVNYNLNKNIAKADWEGDIVLYGHFGRTTKVDKLYPIEEDTTINDVIEKYQPTMYVYKGEWSGDSLILAAGTHSSSANRPTNVDMSYIAFKGEYGLNDYAVFDFTGDNMPIVSFFNNTITNSVFNNATTTSDAAGLKDSSVTGWVWFNGLYQGNGTVFGGVTGTHASRLSLLGKQKVLGFDDGSNSKEGGFRVNDGSSASNVCPISINALQNVTDTYRMIIGIGKNASASRVNVEMYAFNMVTGKQVYKKIWEVSTAASEDGSIMLYGQFGKKTELDKVFGIEEDTTLDAVIAKYCTKDTDYSDEAAVTLDRYAYTSLSNGQWTLDGKEQVSNPTDYRTMDSTYTTYANAGFNILLAQDMISVDGNKASWEASENKIFMDKAHAAGLKVILTDWHLQIISAPIKISSDGPVNSDKTYVPWILGTDANATSGPAKEWLDTLSALGITADSTRFKDRDALDKWIYDQIAVYKDHPAFYGVMLADEPSYHNAYCYGEIYKSLKRVMPEIYVQYNLLPLEQNFSTIQHRYPGVNAIGKNISNAQIVTAYKSYVESFLDTMGTDYIQYDDYPFKSAEEGFLFWTETTPYVDNTILTCIRVMAEIAKERGLDVKVVTQSCLMKSGGSGGPVHIRNISEADARWLNNYLMGFGVKQINYFTYWTKAANSSSGEYYIDGYSFVKRDGTPTELYNFMKEIMADNTKFAPTIRHFDYNASQIFGSNTDSSLDNAHITWVKDLTAAASFRWITNVTTSKEFTLVTELYDDEKCNYMYMIMNTIDTYYGGNQNVTVTLDSSVTAFYVYDQYGNRTAHTGNTYTVTLNAGQAVYIMPYQFA